MTRDITGETDRLVDLMRQGFMKPLRARKERKVAMQVRCFGCLNWHAKNKHVVTDKATRRANMLAQGRTSEQEAL